MPRESQINISVETGKSVSNINIVKKAFQELNEEINKHGQDGVYKLKMDIDIPNLDTFKKINTTIKKLTKNMDGLNGVLKTTKEVGAVFNINNDNTIKNVNNVKNVFKEYKKSVDNVNKSYKKLDATTIASLAVFATMNKTMLSTLSTYQKLTDATYGVGIAGQMSLSQIDNLNSSFLSLSTTVSRNATELAQAVDGLIRTGRSYDDARQIIQEVAKLSVASGDSLKDTSSVVTKAMVSLGISGDKARETLGTLHSVALQTASDMKYLGNSFKSVAGTASVLVNSSGLAGKELDNYKQKVFSTNMAMIGALANTGISASEAGTKIKNLTSRLISAEKVARNMFDETMKLNNVVIDGKLFDYASLSKMAKKDLPLALETMSKLKKEGVLNDSLMSKMFTNRHFGDISNLLIQINGNIDGFTKRIATGVDYTNDMYKNMFNINEQVKLLQNNVLALGDGSLKHVNDSATGILMLINELLTKFNNNSKNILGKEVSSMVSSIATNLVVAGATITTVFSIGKLLAPLFMGVGSVLGTWILPLTAVITALTFIAKQSLETKKRFLDVVSELDNLPKKLQDVIDESDILNSKIEQTKRLLNDVNTMSLEEGLSNSSILLDTMLSKSKSLKEVLESSKNWHSLDTTNYDKSINNLQKEYNDEKEKIVNYVKQFQRLKNDLTKTVDYTKDDLYIANYGKWRAREATTISKSQALVRQKFLELKEDSDFNKKYGDAELLVDEIYKLLDKKINKRDVRYYISSIDMTGFNALEDSIEKTKQNIENLKNRLQQETEEASKIARDNLDAHNKMLGAIADETIKQLNNTGKINIDGQDFIGVDGLIKIVENSYIESNQRAIENSKKMETDIINNIKSIEDAYLISGTKMSKDDEDTIKRQKAKIESIITARNILVAQSKDITKALSSDKKELFGLIKGIEYSNSTSQDMLGIINLFMEKTYTKHFDPKAVTKIQDLDKLIQLKVSNLLDLQEREHKKSASNTKYQLKHISYLKENLQLELEIAKIGAVKEKQSYLEYYYKTQTLKANQESAELEKINVEKMLKDYKPETNIGSSYISKALKSNNANDIQKMLNEFEKQYSGIMIGEQGRKIKSDYDQLVKYYQVFKSIEDAGNKFKINIKQALDSIQGIIVSDTFNVLSKQSINFVQPYLDKLNEEFNSTKKQISKDFFNGEDFNLDTALIESTKHIDLLKVIGGDKNNLQNFSNEFKEIFGDNIFDNVINSEENLANLTKEQIYKHKALLSLKQNSLDITDKETKAILTQLEALSSMAGLFNKIGDIFGNKTFSKLGNIVSSFKDSQDFFAKPENNFSFKSIGAELSKGIGAMDTNVIADQLSKAFQSMTKGLGQGTSVGNLIGGLTGGGVLSQQAGGIAGLITGAMGIGGFTGLGIQAGASLIGGLFNKGGVSQAEAERRTKESNKIYNKNTEALQRLAQNMASLSSGVDGLNGTLLNSVSKIPTVDNLDRITGGLEKLYGKINTTRIFQDASYQVTKTKSKKGFLGLGGSSSTWTETNRLSVDDLLRRYGYKGSINTMSSDEMSNFAKWLKTYDLGDTNNFSTLASAVEDYAMSISKMDNKIQRFFYDATMEGFQGVSSLQQQDLRKQIEETYKNLGITINEETSKEIDKIAEQMSVMVTVMDGVRGEFVSKWRDSGMDAGKAFTKSMKPYVDSMLNNISQIYYDVYFSQTNKKLEDNFKDLSEELVRLKRQGENLNWNNVTNSLSYSMEKTIDLIKEARYNTKSFNEVLMGLQKQALDSGLKLSEVFELGLTTDTQVKVVDSFKEALSSSEADSAFKSIGTMVGDKISGALVDTMIDNVMGDKIFEMTSLLDKAVSGNLSFDSLANLSNEAMSVGLMLEGERLRFEAIKDMFDFNKDITYAEQDNSVQYTSGTSQKLVQNFYLSSNVEAGNVIESDSVERLADSLLDIILDKLKVERGIVLA